MLRAGRCDKWADELTRVGWPWSMRVVDGESTRSTISQSPDDGLDARRRLERPPDDDPRQEERRKLLVWVRMARSLVDTRF